jgi:hypothetical protein
MSLLRYNGDILLRHIIIDDRSVVFPGIPVSPTNKTDRSHIPEILLKVALNSITLTYEMKGTDCTGTIMTTMAPILLSLKAYRLSELKFFVDIKSFQYSMFYTNKIF